MTTYRVHTFVLYGIFQFQLYFQLLNILKIIIFGKVNDLNTINPYFERFAEIFSVVHLVDPSLAIRRGLHILNSIN